MTRDEQEADHAAEQLVGGYYASPTKAPMSEQASGDLHTRTQGSAPGLAASTAAATPSVQAVISSSGHALPQAFTEEMGQRFGHDFSAVRVHSGSGAEQSAAALRASAYTVGRHIVLGAGSPPLHTPEGRRLMAHELTHVVQQSGHGRPGWVQRKEITGSVYDTLRKRLPPQDWYGLHREEWQQASDIGAEQLLNPANTFMRAAWYNTLKLRPGEYETVRERHNYYDLISYVIEYDPGTPKAVRDVRFFHAATAVTGSPGIGSVDTPIGYAKLSADTRQILRDVNAELFALNMQVIHNLLSDWKEPRDPQSPAGRISAFDFDIRMVETEQGLVEQYLSQHRASFTPTVVQEINQSMDPTAFGQFFNFSRRSFEWASKALGIPKPDFTIHEHRKAIGFASVHIFHRKSEADYLAFMSTRVSFKRPPNQYAVGNLHGVALNDGLPGPLLTFDLPVGTMVEVIDWSHLMGPHLLGDDYAGKVEVRVLDGLYQGKTGWVDFVDLG